MNGNIESHATSMVFLWLEGTPNMDMLDWLNSFIVNVAKTLFHRYIIGWKPYEINKRNLIVPQSANDDLFLLNTAHIFSFNPS